MDSSVPLPVACPADAGLTLEARVLAEQISLVYRHTVGSFAMAAVVGVLMWMVLRPVLPAPWMDVWLGALFATYMPRMALVYAYRRRRPLAGLRFWLRAYIGAAFVTGAVWGLIGTLLFPTANGAYQSAAILVVAGVPAAGLFALSPLMPAFVAFATPIIVPAMLYQLAGPTEQRLVGIGLMLFAPTLFATAWRLQRFNADSLRLRFEREGAAEERERARLAAEAANRAKSRFLANMSHEIRTPLNGVMGLAELMLGTRLDAQQRGYMRTLHASGESLLQIINDILDFSKIEAGKIELQHTPFDLRAAVSELVDLFAERARARGLALALEVGPDVPATLAGDALRLRQVLVNLVGNAIKFTVRGGVRLRIGSGVPPFETDCPCAAGPLPPGRVPVWFAVIDTGPGIPREDRCRLFQAFEQGSEAAPGRRAGGTGLGLAISRQLVELMGGHIGVTSEPGCGAAFHFVVPLDLAAAPAMAASPVPGSALAALAGRVLLVEDNVVNREIARVMLGSLGLDVLLAENGVEAVAAIGRERVDAVLMDCLMPEMDGFEATRAIRSRERDGEHVPIIALTANAVEGDRQSCLAAGMDDYLAKPFKKADLHAMLAKWLARPGVVVA